MSEKSRKMKRCVIYTRVSTDNQAEVEFNSCEAQEQKIKYYIDSQEKLKYYGSYHDEGFTGANMKRPSLQALYKILSRNNFKSMYSFAILLAFLFFDVNLAEN